MKACEERNKHALSFSSVMHTFRGFEYEWKELIYIASLLWMYVYFLT